MKTFYNQRDLKDQLTHICPFIVIETTGDLARTKVKKLMISNASTRMKIFVSLTCTSFLKLQFKEVQGNLHLNLVSIYFGFKGKRNHSSSPHDFIIK